MSLITFYDLLSHDFNSLYWWQNMAKETMDKREACFKY